MMGTGKLHSKLNRLSLTVLTIIQRKVGALNPGRVTSLCPNSALRRNDIL